MERNVTGGLSGSVSTNLFMVSGDNLVPYLFVYLFVCLFIYFRGNALLCRGNG